jgi:hypothetical protein
MNTDTPLPQEEPAGQNPPDGAIIDYYLPGNAKDITLEISQYIGLGHGMGRGTLIQRFSNHDTLYKIGNVNIPLYWIRPQQILSAQKGAHRFVWDLHYQPLNIPPSYPIAAIYQNTAPDPTSPWVMPGDYTLRLTVDGKTFTQQLAIKMDPRVKTSLKDLQLQHDLSVQAYSSREQILQIINEISVLKIRTTNQAMIDSLNKMLNGVPGNQQASFTQLNAVLASLHNSLQDSDWPPTTQMVSAMKDAQANFQKLLQRWNEMKKKLNQ